MAHDEYTLLSVLELRQNFGTVREGIAKGKQYVVLYRGEPIAELKPVSTQTRDRFFTAPKSASSSGARTRKNVAAKKKK